MKTKTYNFADETAELQALLLQVRKGVDAHGHRAPQPMFELWTSLSHLLGFTKWRQKVVAGNDSPPADRLSAMDATYRSATELLQGIEIGRFPAEPEYASSKGAEAILIGDCAFSLLSVACSWESFERHVEAKAEAHRALNVAMGRVATSRLQLDAVHGELLRDLAACESFARTSTAQ